MKTKEELNALKEEVETLNKKLAELNEEELAQVNGGSEDKPCYNNPCGFYVNCDKCSLYSSCCNPEKLTLASVLVE